MGFTFILGAGFSVDQRFPSVRDLKQQVVNFLEAERHGNYEPVRTKFQETLTKLDPTGNMGSRRSSFHFGEEMRMLTCCKLSHQAIPACYGPSRTQSRGSNLSIWLLPGRWQGIDPVQLFHSTGIWSRSEHSKMGACHGYIRRRARQ
jgi:hypothetical protein